MKTTAYFDTVVSITHPEVRQAWIEAVLANPLHKEVQSDGRIRYWGVISEFNNLALRVVTLADSETVHNAFFDRGFTARRKRRSMRRKP